MNRMPLPHILALAGTLPFIACAALTLTGGFQHLGIDWAAVGRSYGLVIAAFMSGAHWGQAIGQPVGPAGRPSWTLLASSNAAAIILWLGFAFLAPTGQMLALIVVFLGLLRIDHWLRGYALIANDYFRIRLVATMVAVVSLALSSIGRA